MKKLIVAVALFASAAAQADEGFRPWGDPVARGAGQQVSAYAGPGRDVFGFQPFLATQKALKRPSTVEDASIAAMVSRTIGFRPWAS
ncbi:MAG: hypothetical protein ACT4NU_05835 [Chromatiales bacterium]